MSYPTDTTRDARPCFSRSEVHHLATYWAGQTDNPTLAKKRLDAIERVLGSAAIADAHEHAESNLECGEDDGYFLEVPSIDRPDDPCPDFVPTQLEGQVLVTLYKILIARGNRMAALVDQCVLFEDGDWTANSAQALPSPATPSETVVQ